MNLLTPAWNKYDGYLFKSTEKGNYKRYSKIWSCREIWKFPKFPLITIHCLEVWSLINLINQLYEISTDFYIFFPTLVISEWKWNRPCLCTADQCLLVSHLVLIEFLWTRSVFQAMHIFKDKFAFSLLQSSS